MDAIGGDAIFLDSTDVSRKEDMKSRGGGVEGGLTLARARSSLFRRCAGTFHTLFSALHDIYYSQPATSSA